MALMPKSLRNPAQAAIALGSNLGNRRRHLDAAVAALARAAGVEVIETSTFIETPPFGPRGQRDYFNAACLVRTTRSPHSLLRLLRRIECRRGRDRINGHRWGPRTLDLDLLLYDAVVIDTSDLTVPHQRLHSRRFVLEPLAEIAPNLAVPTFNRTVRELLAELDACEAGA